MNDKSHWRAGDSDQLGRISTVFANAAVRFSKWMNIEATGAECHDCKCAIDRSGRLARIPSETILLSFSRTCLR